MNNNNINTKGYWENRFLQNWVGDGEKQTLEYAKANVKILPVSKSFNGTILDFGCALGDAIPVYSENFPNARLIGADISENAIKICKQKYETLAEFFSGDINDIPNVDIIIASHVMEHITEDKKIIRTLLEKCKDLFVFVPYKECPLYIEHVNYYESDYYDDMNVLEKKEFIVKYKKRVSLRMFLKNAIKMQFALNQNFEKEIIMFHFQKINSIGQIR